MDWTRDGAVYRATLDGHELAAYRTPGRARGWTLEVDGVPDEGLTGCCRRAPSTWPRVRSLVERVARARVRGPEEGRSAWAGVRCDSPPE